MSVVRLFNGSVSLCRFAVVVLCLGVASCADLECPEGMTIDGDRCVRVNTGGSGGNGGAGGGIGGTGGGLSCNEGQSCGTTDIGACEFGSVVCDDNNNASCSLAIEPATEACDSVDNDCDGTVDEDSPGNGESCGSNDGVCEFGEQKCVMGAFVCQGGVVAGNEASTCDGLDNDCDMAVDEGISDCCENDEEMPCGTNTGECMQGMRTCSNNAWGACVDAVGASPETCNKKDDDCDNRTDEGIPDGCKTMAATNVLLVNGNGASKPNGLAKLTFPPMPSGSISVVSHWAYHARGDDDFGFEVKTDGTVEVSRGGDNNADKWVGLAATQVLLKGFLSNSAQNHEVSSDGTSSKERAIREGERCVILTELLGSYGKDLDASYKITSTNQGGEDQFARLSLRCRAEVVAVDTDNNRTFKFRHRFLVWNPLDPNAPTVEVDYAVAGTNDKGDRVFAVPATAFRHVVPTSDGDAIKDKDQDASWVLRRSGSWTDDSDVPDYGAATHLHYLDPTRTSGAITWEGNGGDRQFILEIVSIKND